MLSKEQPIQIDQPQSELNSKADEIINNPEEPLQRFVSKPPSEIQQMGVSGINLHRNIANRLNGNPPDSKYLFSLGRAPERVSEPNEEKEGLLAAAMIYEFKNIKDMTPDGGYNPKVLFRTALRFAKEQKGLLGVTMQKHINTIPLGEIFNRFKNQLDLPEDLPRLSEIAMERLHTEEEAANEVLDTTTTFLFSLHTNTRTKLPEKKKFLKVVKKKGLYMKEFNLEVLDYAFIRLRYRNSKIFDSVLTEIHEKLSQNNIDDKDKIPLDEDEFKHKFRDKNSFNIKLLENERDEIIFLDRIVNSLPILNQAYNEYVQKKELQTQQIQSD